MHRQTTAPVVSSGFTHQELMLTISDFVGTCFPKVSCVRRQISALLDQDVGGFTHRKLGLTMSDFAGSLVPEGIVKCKKTSSALLLRICTRGYPKLTGFVLYLRNALTIF